MGILNSLLGFPGGSDGKESACNSGYPGSIPGSERSPGEGNDNPLQYSCPENPMDRGAWWVIAHGITTSQIMTKRLNNKNFLSPPKIRKFLWKTAVLGLGLSPGTRRWCSKTHHSELLPAWTTPWQPKDRGAWWATVYGVTKSWRGCSD